MSMTLRKSTIKTKKALGLLIESLWDKRWFRVWNYFNLLFAIILASAILYFILYSDIAMTDDTGKVLDFKEISSNYCKG